MARNFSDAVRAEIASFTADTVGGVTLHRTASLIAALQGLCTREAVHTGVDAAVDRAAEASVNWVKGKLSELGRKR